MEIASTTSFHHLHLQPFISLSPLQMINNYLFKHLQFSPSGDGGIYSQRGVSAQKEEVHAAIQKLDAGLYPHAFCKMYPDFIGSDGDFVNIMHADGAGTARNEANDAGGIAASELAIQD